MQINSPETPVFARGRSSWNRTLRIVKSVDVASPLHALALTLLIMGLTASCTSERPDRASLAAVGPDFVRVSLPSLVSDRPYEDYDSPAIHVLEVALDGCVTDLGLYPGDGPRQPWPAAELEARLGELGARMRQAVIFPGATETAPDCASLTHSGAAHARNASARAGSRLDATNPCVVEARSALSRVLRRSTPCASHILFRTPSSRSSFLALWPSPSA